MERAIERILPASEKGLFIRRWSPLLSIVDVARSHTVFFFLPFFFLTAGKRKKKPPFQCDDKTKRLDLNNKKKGKRRNALFLRFLLTYLGRFRERRRADDWSSS